MVGAAPAAGVSKAVGKSKAAPPKKEAPYAFGLLEGDDWKFEGTRPGVANWLNAAYFMVIAFLYETFATIFSAASIEFKNDRKGLTRSAILLILFIVIHAVGNLHIFKGPDDFNGYGYFYVRLYWTGFGLPANIVEEYILLGALLHIMVGLKRTWDMKLALVKTQGVAALNLAISGLMLLTFMTIHLFQFRFGDTEQFGPYYVRPPPYLINFWGILSLNLFWTDDSSVAPVGVRDIYALEFEIFKNPMWSIFYILSLNLFWTDSPDVQ